MTASQPNPPQPQYQQPQYQPAYPAAPQAPPGQLNVFGIVALALIAFNLLFVIVQPLVYRGISETTNLSIATTLISGVQTVILVIALVFGVIGLLQKQRPRMRWTAIGATVCAGQGILATLLSMASWALIPY